MKIRKVAHSFLISTLCAASLQVIQLSPSYASGNVKLGVMGVQYSSSDDALTKQQYLPREHSLSLSVNGKSISQIDSGSSKNCLVADGNIYCWGEGIPSPAEVTKPPLFGDKKFTKVSVGGGTVCAIADSQAYCWGYGSSGQIGNGASGSVSTPTPVSTLGVLAGKTVTDISVGDSHVCAVAEGKVYCWGYNGYGQLGDGTSTNSNSPIAVATTGVLSGKTISQISVGSSHTCAIASGAAYCWGYNGYGQLGDGTSTNSNSPIAVATTGVLRGKTISQISVGSRHTCAIASGAAYCWGYNLYGQLGDGTSSSSNSPVAVVTYGVLSGKSLTSISADTYSNCAIASGAAYCWGYNYSGQLGNGSRTNSSLPTAVTSSGALIGKSLLQIATGSSHSCAATTSELFCWGQNSSFELGDTTTTNSSSPVKVLTSSDASSASEFHSISTDINGLFKFVADNKSYSQSVSLDSGLKVKTLPTADSLGTLAGKTISKAVYGSGFACYLVQNRVYCAGQNSLGQLGNGTQAVSSDPVEIDMSGALKGLSITDVSAGAAHVCVIAGGKVFCWGSNSQGQLGVSDTRDSSNGFKTIASLSPIPVDTSGVLSKDAVVQDLTTSVYSTCVVASGAPYCWGSPVPGFHKSNSAYGLPLALADNGELSGKKVLKISISSSQAYFWDPVTTCAVTVDGEGYCWGNSAYNGGSSRVTTPTKLDLTQIGVRKITDIEVGYNNGCALALGQMYCWGLNSNGQLGTGDNLNSSRPKLVSQAGILKDQEVLSMYLTSNTTYFTYRAASSTLLQQRKEIVDAELKAIADAKAAAALELLNATNQAKLDADMATRERIQFGDGALITPTSSRTSSIALTGVTSEKIDGALKPHSLDIPSTFGGRTATSVYVGGTFACAIAGGAPYCWGNNNYGQLGNGTTSSSAVPSPVQLPEKIKGKAITKLSVGGTSACVVVEGEAFCWGNNDNGQLGIASVRYSMIPVAVDTSGALKNLKISTIDVGEIHTCAIANGKAFCWGSNASSQLGNAKAKKEAILTPTEVDSDGILKDKILTSIAVGTNHTCTSTINELVCWGADYGGQLGFGSYGGIKEIADVKTLQFSSTAVKQISSIEANSNATCVVADSNLYCWGSNVAGRFDQASSSNIVKPTKIELVGPLLGREIQDVGLGADYLCVLASSAPLCWGGNEQGQLGNGTLLSSTTPTKVASTVVKQGSTLDLSISGGTSCAIAVGRVYCWGTSYQLQGGRLSPISASTPLPVGIDSSELQFKSITALRGNDEYPQFSFVADGSAYSLNPRIDKTLNPITFPTLPTNLGPLLGKEILKYIVESEFQCYLANYEMYCQGSNNLGQLGNNSTQYSEVPMKVDTSGVLKGKKITDFVMGNAHVCVLADGEVFCWGNNVLGQLGISNEKDAFGAYKLKFSNQPVAIDTSGVLKGKKITSLEAGNQSTCVVAGGEIFCWGQLHSSFRDPKNVNQESSGIPVELQKKGELSGKQISKVVLPPYLYSSSLMCALAENRAFCWSTGRSTGSLNKEVTAPHVVGDKLLYSRPVSDIALSNSHACLISMGEVFCWGENSNGQLGIGTITSQAMPVLMDGGEILKNREVFAIALTSNTTMVAHRALTADKSKTFSDLKTEIQKQVAEEERLKAIADAEARAKAEAEAKARADLARKNELIATQTNLSQQIQNLSQTNLALRAKCEAVSRNLTAQQRIAIARTAIITSCDLYSDTLSSLTGDLGSLNVDDVSESNYSGKVATLKAIASQISNVQANIYALYDENVRIGNDFENLIYLEDQYAKSSVKDYRDWINLEARVQKLPTVTRKTIMGNMNYRNAENKAIVIRSAQSDYENYAVSLSAITTTKELSSAANQLASIIAKVGQASNLYLDIAAIEKLIPPFVCTKGSSVTPLPKNGKCLAGAKKTSTR